MKTYTKTHSNGKALTNHASKIRRRGGTYKTKKVGKATKIVYSFDKKAQLSIL